MISGSENGRGTEARNFEKFRQVTQGSATAAPPGPSAVGEYARRPVFLGERELLL
jgi:hypothetical protein